MYLVMMKLQKKMDVFGIIFECSEAYKIFFLVFILSVKVKKKEDGKKKRNNQV